MKEEETEEVGAEDEKEEAKEEEERQEEKDEVDNRKVAEETGLCHSSSGSRFVGCELQSRRFGCPEAPTDNPDRSLTQFARPRSGKWPAYVRSWIVIDTKLATS